MIADQQLEQAQRIADAIAGLPGIVAVTLGGSVASGLADAASDLDLHVYWRTSLALPQERVAYLNTIADPGSVIANILTWGLEDHFRVGGQLVELVYVPLDDLQAEVEQAYGKGLISEGFTTARLYYLVQSKVLIDSAGEIGALRSQLQLAYPEPTRRLLLAHHPALLRFALSNIRKGLVRNDLPFVQQSRSNVQMIYFNLLFALNRRYHPGEKRLLTHVASFTILPHDFVARWQAMLRVPNDNMLMVTMLEALIVDFEQLLEDHQ